MRQQGCGSLGFTSPLESWKHWGVVTTKPYTITLGLVATALLVGGCQTGARSAHTASLASAADAGQKQIDDRKDEMVRQLAHCESGGSGPSDRPIYGGRGAYLGRLQFSVRTVMSYQARRDGTRLSAKEAAELAHDYDRAADLAKYMIFDLEEPWHWPLCARKISLRDEMAAIKQLSNQAMAR